ncbi:MAG: choice-of-anchor B family protein, partial [Gammaproteobacteria bacterium]|nr:choice-of-anchor B family protein [Gammaproteobacteria bacterium]
GDRILVAQGNYFIESAEDVFYLTSGLVGVFGGFNKIDHYQKQQPDKNPSTLIGVPVEYRDKLVARGFHVIIDQKGLRSEVLKEIDKLSNNFKKIQISSKAQDCIGGAADGTFTCDKIDLLSHVALIDFSTNPNATNDIWGFVDLNTQREYAIIGLRNGAAVMDVTDPENPLEIGSVTGEASTWRDIKVYQFYDSSLSRWQAYAYVTTDATTDKLIIIDLTGLPNNIRLSGRETAESSAHNVYISNVDYTFGIALPGLQPILQSAGSNLSGGAFRAYDLTNPAQPVLESVSPSGGYMHDGTSLTITDSRKDTQCVNAGTSCELFVDFNETSFEIWDISDINDVQLLSSSIYANTGYVHSGWWSEDKQFIFAHDETDEQQHGLKTTLRIFDVSDLTNPAPPTTWSGPTNAIDHNGYVRGNRYYMSNYTKGLTVLNITNPANPSVIGEFDTFPVSNSSSFSGAWGVYPFLLSGNIVVSDIDSGLYVLGDDTKGSANGQLSFITASFGGEEGANINLSVQRQAGSLGAVDVSYEILEGSAGGGDFTLAAGTLSWTDGDTAAKNISIDLLADANVEDVERFFVRLVNPTNGATLAIPNVANVFIADTTGNSELNVLDDQIGVQETLRKVFVPVSRSGSVDTAVTVSYRTVDQSAVGGTDFQAVTAGQLSWPAGDATGRV